MGRASKKAAEALQRRIYSREHFGYYDVLTKPTLGMKFMRIVRGR
jgi:hypothetical protein